MKVSRLVLGPALLLAIACGDSSGGGSTADAGMGPGEADGGTGAGASSDDQLAAQAVAKIKECKVDPGGSPEDNDLTIEDESDRCGAKCVIGAGCTELTTFICADGIPAPSDPVAACLSKCPKAPADGVACSDGSKIAHSALCDGFEDCTDGKDETDCGEFACDDGETVSPKDVTCDGFDDCSDGSDEKGCANVCG